MLFRPISQPPLSVRQRNDLKEELLTLFESLPEGVSVYALGTKVPRTLASTLIGISLCDTRLFPGECSGLTIDSVAFLQVKFRFDGWFWLQKIEAIHQFADVIRELIDKDELEVLYDGGDPFGPEGPRHIIRLTNRPIVTA